MRKREMLAWGLLVVYFCSNAYNASKGRQNLEIMQVACSHAVIDARANPHKPWETIFRTAIGKALAKKGE